MSSLSFAGNSTSYISIASSNDTKMGTGDFTIEWYQYQTDSNSFPRVFQIGNYSLLNPTLSMGVSIETGTFYYWRNDSYANSFASVGSIKNTWTHFAIVRSSGTTTIYKNGNVFITGFSDTTDYNSSLDLLISNETTRSDGAAFGGYMAYFHIIKGAAKYTSSFSVSNTFPTATTGTVLLLKASGNTGSNITVTNVGTISQLPPGFQVLEPEPEPEAAPLVVVKKPLYSNNLVFYKAGTVSSTTGSSSVRNSRFKSRKT
jgi:hypothetical protein